MSDLWNLRKLNLFVDLKPKTMEQVLRIVTVKHIQRGKFVFRPGDACDRLYLLQHGRVKTYVNSEQGQEKIMHVFYPGDAFGGVLFGTTHGELPWAKALEDVIVVSMDEAAFKRFIQAFPDLCINIFRYMADHHAEDMRRLESFIHTDAGHRLLVTLLNLGDRLGYSDAASFQLSPGFTHEELANMIGVARTTVSELIGQLRRAGVLGGQGRNLIVNRQAAKQYLLEDKT